MNSSIWLNKAVILSMLYFINYCTGYLVINRDVKVNYTRKINHFSLFFLPVFIERFLSFEHTPVNYLIGCIIGVASLLVYLHPVRSRVPTVNQMFASFDRPEDRPHTMLWLITQVIGGYFVMTLFIGIFMSLDCMALIFIPIFINGIGDGLAEPVGIRFGKHKYKVRALFSKEKYERSLEGSACVFITSIIIVIAFNSYFTLPEFVTVLIAMPILMTLAEAFSPHTWDTPFLYLTGFSIIAVAKSGIIF